MSINIEYWCSSNPPICYFQVMVRDLYEEIVELRSRGIRSALATVIARKGATPRKESAKMLIYEDGRQMGSIGGGSPEAEVSREALSVMETGEPKLLTFDLTNIDPEESALVCGGSMQVYVEPLLPDPTLFIFGAGHVGKAVAEVAKSVGFRTAIIDDRIKYANPKRFPDADSLYVDSWEEVANKLNLNSCSYIFIATREHRFDLVCLRFAVQSSAKYIGLLGSRKKAKSLFDQLEKEGIELSNLQRVFAPAGIDIGSDTPEEIAVSIAAELIAVRKGLDIRRLKAALYQIKNAAQSAASMPRGPMF
jgi:xanthine dehydrogenase accessory factor